MRHGKVFAVEPLVLAVGLACSTFAYAADGETSHGAGDQEQSSNALTLEKTLVTAEEELKQAPGVSIITAEDIAKRPPVNDLSDIIRRMPGVNLTGNSASGVRGNNRQIDLRGMGPENTLILIDGKPVTSRNSVRYTRNGERDTRGDTNWVPAEEVERIEVIRGPAAARYGSGAAGGVVNIITKGITDELHGSATTYYNLPEDDAEGAGKRVNFGLSGPLSEQLGFRVYGSYNKTDGDDGDINADAAAETGAGLAAGREGVRNKDINGLLRWHPADEQTVDFQAGYSRQGNIYAGDVTTGESTSAVPASLVGSETNVMTRNIYSVSHQGDWSWGTSNTYFQYEDTRNRRLLEGTYAGVEGNITNSSTSGIPEMETSELKSYTWNGELNIPFQLGLHQVATLGAEWNRQELDDPASITQDVSEAGISLPGVAAKAIDRNQTMAASIRSLYLEDNIEVLPNVRVTPGVRLDHHDDFGNNWSPSLNATWEATSEFTVKGGIARVFKAPNLFQSTPGYLYRSNGNGCPLVLYRNGACYIMGNDNLDPEISVNKELGINFKRDGWSAGVTWFRNDYDNKITAGTTPYQVLTSGNTKVNVLRWENATDAVVQGWEAHLQVPVADTLTWTNNFTYMEKNDDQDGQPLSQIPKYTLNSMLDWQATEQLGLNLTGTFYGEQEARTLSLQTQYENSGIALNKRGAYHIFGLNAQYRVSNNLRLGAGISNLFDKQLYREGAGNSAGAATYNEAGRAYFMSATASF